jgi:hypothetical protein
LRKLIKTNGEFSLAHRLLPTVAGIVLIGATFLLEIIVEVNLSLGVEIILVGSGCAFAVLGFVARSRQLHRALARASLVILSTTMVVAMSEAVFRVVGFDFTRLNEPGNEVPIYYRRPTFHAGEGIFRRPGPASWHGKVLCSYMHMLGAGDGPYAHEEPVLAEYDALGFRNPIDLTNWEVVVTGDSFVELGYLPYEELFTTIAAKRLGVRIKNLGVSGTGPISQTFYVKSYGRAASTKDAVLCFFDGNDLEDLSRELRNVESFRATGRSWAYRPQVSLIKAVWVRLGTRHRGAGSPAPEVIPNAALVVGGWEHPMTLYGKPPPVWDQTSETQRNALIRSLENWAKTVRENRMRPWVMYFTGNQRVFDGFIRYSNNPVVLETREDFATPLGAACTNLGIGFINTFPALRQATETGQVPYNLIGDGHLSRDGSRIVAEVLADALKASVSTQ